MPPHGLFHIGVGQQDHRVFTAHFALHLFQAAGPFAVDAGADFGGAGEGDAYYVGAPHQGIAHPPSRAATGPKDFRRRLESGELRYPIQGGQLRQREFGDEPSQARTVKFSRRDIDLVVRTIHGGSDADKLLAPYAKRGTSTRRRIRRFEFEIQGPDEFAFHGYFIEDPKWKR